MTQSLSIKEWPPLSITQRQDDLLLSPCLSKDAKYISFKGIDDEFEGALVEVVHIGHFTLDGKPFLQTIKSDKYKDFWLSEQALTQLALSLSGWGCLIVINQHHNKIYVLTDKMGVLPVFYIKTAKGVFIDWDQDYLASQLNISEFDYISLSEVLLRGSITPPYSLYKDIQVLRPATILTIDSKTHQMSFQDYWKPAFKSGSFKSLDAAATAVAEAIQTSVDKFLSSGLRIDCLLSGGLDSRALLPFISQNAVTQPSAYTVFSESNLWSQRELKVAKQLAKHYGIEHYTLKRTVESLRKSFYNGAMTCGGSHNLRHCYLGGFDDFSSYSFKDQSFLMTACFADHLFKMKNPKSEEIKSSKMNLNWFSHRYNSENKYINFLVDERLLKFATERELDESLLRTEEGRAHIAMQRCRPIYGLRTFAFRKHLMSTRKLVLPLLENEVLDVWQMIGDKRGNNLWVEVLKKIDTNLLSFSDSNTGLYPDVYHPLSFQDKIKSKGSKIVKKINSIYSLKIRNQKKPISSWDDSETLLNFRKEIRENSFSKELAKELNVKGVVDFRFWTRLMSIQEWIDERLAKN